MSNVERTLPLWYWN